MGKDLITFYYFAKKHCIEQGYEHEIDLVKSRLFDQQSVSTFLREYVFVVISAGMKNQVAVKIFKEYIKKGTEAVGHAGKQKAIRKAHRNYRTWFNKLKAYWSTEEKLDYLETLPWIGPITKYHLARNLGLDVAKPDRHLVRIADHFEYDVQTMCRYIALKTGDKIGVVDIILWRYSNLNPPWKQKKGKVVGW